MVQGRIPQNSQRKGFLLMMIWRLKRLHYNRHFFSHVLFFAVSLCVQDA